MRPSKSLCSVMVLEHAWIHRLCVCVCVCGWVLYTPSVQLNVWAVWWYSLITVFSVCVCMYVLRCTRVFPLLLSSWQARPLMFGHMLSLISQRHQSCWPAVRTAALSVLLPLYPCALHPLSDSRFSTLCRPASPFLLTSNTVRCKEIITPLDLFSRLDARCGTQLQTQTQMFSTWILFHKPKLKLSFFLKWVDIYFYFFTRLTSFPVLNKIITITLPPPCFIMTLTILMCVYSVFFLAHTFYMRPKNRHLIGLY